MGAKPLASSLCQYRKLLRSLACDRGAGAAGGRNRTGGGGLLGCRGRDGHHEGGLTRRTNRYSENCWPSTPPPLEATTLKPALSRRWMACTELSLQ